MEQIHIVQSPKVLVVVPSYNQGNFIEETLNSIFGQTYKNTKIVVMDGGSTDNSVEVIKRYSSKLVYWRSYPDEGQAAAINEGINYGQDCEYVCWLNSDDILLPAGIERMVNFLENKPGYLAVFGKAFIIDENSNQIGVYPTEEFSKERFSLSCTICQPATLIRSSAWYQAGGLNEKLHMCMDYDLWWKISSVGLIGHLKEFVACSRDYSTTKTRTNQKIHYWEAFQILKRYLGYVPWKWCKSRALNLVKFKNPVLKKIVAAPLAIWFYSRAILRETYLSKCDA